MLGITFGILVVEEVISAAVVTCMLSHLLGENYAFNSHHSYAD